MVKYWEKPPATKVQILEFVKNALENRSKKQEPLFLGRPKDEAIERIKNATGYNIDKVTLLSDTVIHALKEGQFEKHKLSPDDVTKIMQIINDKNTYIQISETLHRGQYPVEFVGNINGKIILVQTMKKRFNELKFLDMYRPYKEKIAEAEMLDNVPPSAYVRNESAPVENIVKENPIVNQNLKKYDIHTNPKKEKKLKKVEAKNKTLPTIQSMQKVKKKLSPTQLAALAKGRATRAKNLAAAKGTAKSVKKNPAAKKPAAKKTTNSKQLGKRKIVVRSNPNALVLDAPPTPQKNGRLMYIGRLPEISYVSEKGENHARPYIYNHKFSKPYPFLATDGKNLFIVKGNKKMHFDFNRGIVN